MNEAYQKNRKQDEGDENRNKDVTWVSRGAGLRQVTNQNARGGGGGGKQDARTRYPPVVSM